MSISRLFAAPRNRLILAAIATGAGLAFTGCAGEHGAIWSDDRYVFASRAWEPKTITLIDTRTGEAVWSVDVPVGQQVIVSFSKGTGPNEYKPDEIVWGLAPEGRNTGGRNNRMPCPGRESRRLDMTLRPTPELAGASLPGPTFDRAATTSSTTVTTQTGQPGTPVVPRGPAVMPPDRRPSDAPPAPESTPEPMQETPTN